MRNIAFYEKKNEPHTLKQVVSRYDCPPKIPQHDGYCLHCWVRDIQRPLYLAEHSNNARLPLYLPQQHRTCIRSDLYPSNGPTIPENCKPNACN